MPTATVQRGVATSNDRKSGTPPICGLHQPALNVGPWREIALMVHMTTNALTIPGHRYVPGRGLNAWAFRYPHTLRRRAGLHKRRHSTTAWRRGKVDPERTFRIGPMNGREARENGLWLKGAACARTGSRNGPRRLRVLPSLPRARADRRRIAAGQLASSSSSSKQVLRSMGFHKDVTEVLDHVEGAHALGECGRRHPDPAISRGVDVKDKERVGLGVVGAER